ncbi:tagatose-bisphosphate aldolase, partial [Enterococcus faecium]
QQKLQIAHDTGAKYNGLLCARDTWAASEETYIKEGEKAAREWLRTTGFENIDELNKVLVKTASPWTDKVE